MTIEQKVDRVIQLLEGDGHDAPGVISRLGRVERQMFGDNKEFGIKTKVTIMWRIHIWILCTASGLAGYALHSLVHYL